MRLCACVSGSPHFLPEVWLWMWSGCRLCAPVCLCLCVAACVPVGVWLPVPVWVCVCLCGLPAGVWLPVWVCVATPMCLRTRLFSLFSLSPYNPPALSSLFPARSLPPGPPQFPANVQVLIKYKVSPKYCEFRKIVVPLHPNPTRILVVEYV